MGTTIVESINTYGSTIRIDLIGSIMQLNQKIYIIK
jgi:hypothetical protein